MDQETYEHHKQKIAEGQIARLGGRTAATMEELDALRRVDDQVVFGGQGAVKPGEIMAIDSGRLTPEDIQGMGPEHPVIVAAQRLTTAQLDGLVDHVTQPLLDEIVSKEDEIKLKDKVLETKDVQLKIKDDALKAKDSELQSSKALAETTPKPTLEQDMNLSEDPREQGVQAQMATGAIDNISPKTVLDNKTDAATPAGKNASKAAADTAQDQEKATAKNGG